MNATTCAAFLWAAVLVLATSCERSNEGTSERPRPAGETVAGEPRRGGRLTVALQSTAKTLDPHKAADAASMRLIENLYSSLMRYKKQYGEFEPDLAERYEIAGDGLTYTFHLRPSARFHSGRAVTAADVAYSIGRIRKYQVRADQFAAIERIETPDSRTVVFHLSRPSAPLLSAFADPMNAVVDREAVEANDGALDSVEAGSGPFRLVQWMKARHLIMERNSDYYEEGLPYLDVVEMQPIPDETARTTALRNRELDVVLDVPTKDIPIVSELEGIETVSVQGTFWEYVGLNCSQPPFDNLQAREAIAWAVDRGVLNQLVKLGRATVLDGGHIPPNHWAYADLHLYQRNVEKARALLEEAGIEKGTKISLKVGSSFPYQVDAAQVVKQHLEEVGFRVELRALESSVFFEDLGNQEFQMTLVGWVGFVDPDEWTYNLFHSKGKYNQQAYSNAEVDRLLERGRRTLDREERRRIYTEIQRIVTTEAPMVFLYVNDQVSSFLSDVRGFVVHPTASTIWLRETWLARD